jgi:hypothetical protein
MRSKVGESSRTTPSEVPPAEKGLTMRIGRLGKALCAKLPEGSNAGSARAGAAVSSLRRFISCIPVLVDSEAGDFRLEASNKAEAHMRIAYALRRSRKI